MKHLLALALTAPNLDAWGGPLPLSYIDGRWVTSTQSAFPVRPDGDPTATATRLMAKYRPDLVVPG